MSADEFLKKWGFLPPITYEFSNYSINALYLKGVIIANGETLEGLLLMIDKAVEELNK